MQTEWGERSKVVVVYLEDEKKDLVCQPSFRCSFHLESVSEWNFFLSFLKEKGNNNHWSRRLIHFRETKEGELVQEERRRVTRIIMIIIKSSCKKKERESKRSKICCSDSSAWEVADEKDRHRLQLPRNVSFGVCLSFWETWNPNSSGVTSYAMLSSLHVIFLSLTLWTTSLSFLAKKGNTD
jgi:hypothetical protein